MALTIGGCRFLRVAAIVVASALPMAHAGDISDHIESARENGPTGASAPAGFELETMRALVRLLCESTSIQGLEGMAVGLPEVQATKAWVRYAGREVTGWRTLVTLEGGWLILRGRGQVGCPAEIRWCPRTWCRAP
jgi:hypothetical protein